MNWSSLFRRRTLEGALREVASALGKGVGLTVRDVSSGELARCGDDDVTSRDAGPELRVPGHPPWFLHVAWSETPPNADALAEARAALTAWRAARAELERAERGLGQRARELRLLQELARGASAAHDAGALFEKAAAVLHRGTGAEAVAAVWRAGEGLAACVHLARPLDRPDADRTVERAAAELDPDGTFDGPLEIAFLDSYDPDLGRRSEVHDDEWIIVPIERRGTRVAAMALLLADRGEASLRLVHGTGNQLSLHLDRILTVREAERGRFRSILDSMPQAVLLTDGELRVLQANPAASLLLARLGNDPPAGRLTRVGDLEMGPLADALLRDPEAGPAGSEAHLEDGTVFDVTLSRVLGERGRAEGLVVVMADVTETHRMHEQLAQSEKLSSLGQMMSGVAHELNNPLATVTGYAQLIRASTTDDKLGKRLDLIDREAQRCRKIVQNLLSFARRHEPETRLLSLNEVVESTLKLVAYQLRVENVSLVSALEPDLPAVEGDPHQLQQALLNLVTNAQHAVRSTGRGGTITVITRPAERDGVVLEVRDDGPGVPAASRSRIFDPFFTTKPVGLGTGLGLSLVHSIVTAHGGTIRERGREGRGAIFRIELPPGRSSSEERAAATVARESSKGPAGRILVVDDEESVARLIAETLTADGHEVESASDRRAALDRLAASEFDVVVLDLKMPGMSEARFREEIERARPGLSRSLVLTTGDTVSAEPEALGKRLGSPVLAKPFDLGDLRRAVRSRLATRDR